MPSQVWALDGGWTCSTASAASLQCLCVLGVCRIYEIADDIGVLLSHRVWLIYSGKRLSSGLNTDDLMADSLLIDERLFYGTRLCYKVMLGALA